MSDSTVPPPVMTGYHADYLRYAAIGADTELVAAFRDMETLIRAIVNGRVVVIPLQEIKDAYHFAQRDMSTHPTLCAYLLRWLTPIEARVNVAPVLAEEE
jgi:hypothetical protein